MKNILIIGASGSIAQIVVNMLQKDSRLNVTLFLRDAKRFLNIDIPRSRIIEGDVMDKEKLTEAMKGQEIVYVNLAGNLGQMLKLIVKSMKQESAKHIIYISSIGIYETSLKPILKPYREGADVVEASGLDYTILRPSWYTNDNEIDYELREKGELENVGTISRKSLATVIYNIIHHPEQYRNRNINVSKQDK